MSRIEPRALVGVLLCLGVSPVAGQDNPWRVPGSGTYAPSSQGGSTYGYSDRTWSDRSAPSSGSGWDGRGWDRRRDYEPVPPPSSGRSDYGAGRYSSGQGSYAALPPSSRPPSSLSGAPSMNDGAPYSVDAYGSRRVDGERRDRAWEGHAPSAGFPGDGRRPNTAYQPPQLRLGDFPPLEGEQRLPSEERLPPRSRHAPPPPTYASPSYAAPPPGYAAPAPGYSASAPAYGQPYGYAPYGYRDPALAGPSTLNNGWSAYSGYSGYGLGYSPYGAGIPGPYGW